MKIFNAAPIDIYAVSELRLAVEGLEKVLKEQCMFRDLRENHTILADKLKTVVDLRNKSIDEAIPAQDMNMAYDMSVLPWHGITFKVILNPVVEELIDQALNLSNKYIKMLT